MRAGFPIILSIDLTSNRVQRGIGICVSQLCGRLLRPFSRLFLTATVLFFCVFGPRFALACPVCTTLPETTLADHLIAADVIVLAAPVPGNPFKFVPKQQIKGSPDELARIPEIPFLIDSTTRAAFRANPEMTVLLTYGTVTKDAAGRGLSRKWTRIFKLNTAREHFLDALWRERELWRTSATEPDARIAFFAKYLSHEDPVLRDTALVEMDRAPYDSIQMLRNSVSTDDLLHEFNNINRISFVPVAIRLLGLQLDDDKAKRVVRSRYPRSVLQNSAYAYDWALAGVAMDGPSAVSTIDAALEAANLSLEHKRSLMRALADSGTVSPALRDQIVLIFSRELEQDHSSALEIAIAMRDWNETRLDSQLADLLESEDIDPVTQFIIQTKFGSSD